MKKAKANSEGLRAEYKRSDFGKLERGKYYERVKANCNVVVLDDDVAAMFPNSAAVNDALHSLVDIVRRAAPETTQRPARRRKGRPTG